MTVWEAVKYQLAGVQVSAHADPTGDLNLKLNLRLRLAANKARGRLPDAMGPYPVDRRACGD